MAIVVQGDQRSHNWGMLMIAFASASAVLLSVYLAIIGGIPWYPSREEDSRADPSHARVLKLEDQLKRMEAMIVSLNRPDPVIKEEDSRADPSHARVLELEDQLKRMEAMIVSLNRPDPVIKADCIVELASYGYDDSTKYGYVRTSGGSSEEVLVLDHNGHHRSDHRGMTLMELDIARCITRNRRRFDVHANPDERGRLMENLESKRAGTVILGVTADTAENEDNASLRRKVGQFFGKHGMDISGLKFRGKLTFIMQIGNSHKTLFLIKPNGGESLKMKIAVRGSTADDVTFRQDLV